MSAYTDAVEANLKGCRFVSFGVCPGCEQCQSDYDCETAPEDEGGFSWSSCGICGQHLGGDRYVWHWVDDKDNIIHESDGCPDCLVYISNGDEPEEWEA